MDEFYLYNQLCVLEDIANQYTEGKKLCPVIRANAELVSSRLYRVAVIGEFKRGKSSLINALIGASVLPTDVIPLTAAITRLTYGTQRKIIIHFKDGTDEEKTLDELIDYATKYDSKREASAATVREIEVKYPSVLCKNHIEILDTPGLNDNESMSEVTLSILGDVDAAIVVISATAPLSMTEQNLIVDLIRQEGIRHLAFVVTFLDALMDEEEKDRMLNLIRNRLTGDLLDRAARELGDDPELVEKARKILNVPDLFGVSSRQAMEGFTEDNRKLLKESRFPAFKEELLALLTAAQSADIPKKVESAAKLVESGLPQWKAEEDRRLSEQQRETSEQLRAWEHYIDCSKAELTGLLRDMDASLQKKGLSSQGIESTALEKMLAKLFIKRLSALTPQTSTHEGILDALRAGVKEAEAELARLEKSLQGWVNTAMENTLKQFQRMRQPIIPEDTGLTAKIGAWEKTHHFPAFSWTHDPVPVSSNLQGMNVIPVVKQGLSQSIKDYGSAVNKYIASWRVVLFQQNTKDRDTPGVVESLRSCLDTLEMRQEALKFNYGQHVDRIRKIRESAVSEPLESATAHAVE